jgi:hypothetical protein
VITGVLHVSVWNEEISLTILSGFLYRATNFTRNDRPLRVNNSDPKRSVSEYFIANRDMINGAKNIRFSLSTAIKYLPLRKFDDSSPD